METLTDWQSFASGMVEALQKIKISLFKEGKILDVKHPDWKAKREDYPNEFWKHDARRECLAIIHTITENAQLSYIFIRDHLGKSDWWNVTMNSSVSESRIDSVVKEHAIMIRWYSFHMLVMTIEDTLRSIYTCDKETFSIVGYINFKKIYTRILEVLKLTEYLDFFEILRLSRNTLHSNGLYSPEDGNDRQFTFREEDYRFEQGKPLEWATDQRMIQIFKVSVEIMLKIIKSSEVIKIRDCPRTS